MFLRKGGSRKPPKPRSLPPKIRFSSANYSRHIGKVHSNGKENKGMYISLSSTGHHLLPHLGEFLREKVEQKYRNELAPAATKRMDGHKPHRERARPTRKDEQHKANRFLSGSWLTEACASIPWPWSTTHPLPEQTAYLRTLSLGLYLRESALCQMQQNC